MNSKKEKNKEPNYILLTKIAIAIVGIICTALGIWGLFGLAKVHLAQSKTEGKVIGITLKDIPNSNKHYFVYTFEYTADDGIVRQFEATYTKNKYMPFETLTVRYFNDSKEANPDYREGLLAFWIFLPIGLILGLVDIFAIKNKKASVDFE